MGDFSQGILGSVGGGFALPPGVIDPNEEERKRQLIASAGGMSGGGDTHIHLHSPESSAGILGKIGDARPEAPKDAASAKPDASIKKPDEKNDKRASGLGQEKFHERLDEYDGHERQIHYLKDQGLLTPAQAEQELAYNDAERVRYKQEHPWGSPESAHPGILGKIAHGLSAALQTAAPYFGVRTNMIPGTRENLAAHEAGALGKIEDFGKLDAVQATANAKETPKPELEQSKNASGEPLTTTEGYSVWIDKHTGSQFVQTPQGTIPMDKYMQSTGRPQGTEAPQGSQGGALGSVAGQAAKPAPAAPANAPATSGGAFAPVPGSPQAQPQGALGTVAPAKGFAPAQPKKTGTEEEHFIAQYIKEHSLEDTAANQQAARQAFKDGPSLGDKESQKYNDQIKNALKGTKVDASAYGVDSKDTLASAKESLKAAQDAAKQDRSERSAERVAGAPEAAQNRKDQRTMGYATDETGQLKYMSRADADKIHSTFEEVKNVQPDRQAIRQLNDVQLNTSRYTKAAQDYASVDTAVRAKDQVLMHDLLNKAGLADLKLHGAIEVDLPIISALSEALSRESKSAAYEGLSKQGKALMDGYIRTMAAIPAYQKALTGIGRTNKEMLDLELANIANPSMNPADILRKQKAFQENIDRATEGLPVNLPGLKSAKQVREETERPDKKSGPDDPFGGFDTEKLRNKKF